MKTILHLFCLSFVLLGYSGEAFAGDRAGRGRAPTAPSNVGVDRPISNGGLDLSDDEDDGAFPRVVDEKLEEQKRVRSKVKESIVKDNKVKADDFFHQDIEDNSRRATDD